MFVKEIELQGFKTFADKTGLTLEIHIAKGELYKKGLFETLKKFWDYLSSWMGKLFDFSKEIDELYEMIEKVEKKI